MVGDIELNVKPVGALMVNVSELEGEPVGFATDTRAVPGVASRFDGIVACKSTELWNCVCRFVVCVPTVHRTTAPLTNPVPFTWSCVVFDRAGTVVGDIELKVGPVGVMIPPRTEKIRRPNTFPLF